jgi:hypothetical protein
MAQWCNPAFASVVNGWVVRTRCIRILPAFAFVLDTLPSHLRACFPLLCQLRYIAADRTLAEDILQRAGATPGDTLGSSLIGTIEHVPQLPDSQPPGGAGGAEEEAAEEEEEEEAEEAPAAPLLLTHAPQVSREAEQFFEAPSASPARSEEAPSAEEGAGGGAEAEAEVEVEAPRRKPPLPRRKQPARARAPPPPAREEEEPAVARKRAVKGKAVVAEPEAPPQPPEEEEEEEEPAPVTPVVLGKRKAAAPPAAPMKLRKPSAVKTPAKARAAKAPRAPRAPRRRRKVETLKIYIHKARQLTRWRAAC